eukprot:6131727-Pleurochrysis_carterae.AAC.4
MIGVSFGRPSSSGLMCSAIWYVARRAFASPLLVMAPQSFSTGPPVRAEQHAPWQLALKQLYTYNSQARKQPWRDSLCRP